MKFNDNVRISDISYCSLCSGLIFVQSILDVATAKLNVCMNTVVVDIRGMSSEEDEEFEATDRNNIYLALTILQCILVFKQEEFIKVNFLFYICFLKNHF